MTGTHVFKASGVFDHFLDSSDRDAVDTGTVAQMPVRIAALLARSQDETAAAAAAAAGPMGAGGAPQLPKTRSRSNSSSSSRSSSSRRTTSPTKAKRRGVTVPVVDMRPAKRGQAGSARR